MKNLQEALDKAHKAAGVEPQRSFELSSHFEETEPDSVVKAHIASLTKKAELDADRRQVRLGMQMLLAAADGLATFEDA